MTHISLRASGLLLIGSLLLIGAIVFAWQQGGQQLNPVAEAAEKTQSKAGARATSGTRVSTLGETLFTMSGRLAINGETKRSRGTFDVSAPAPVGPMKILVVSDEYTVYMRSPRLADSLPPGRRWLAIDVLLGNDPKALSPAGANTEQQLAMLSAAGDVQTLGEQEIQGVSTTRYEATIDLHDYAEILRQEDKPGPARDLDALAKKSRPMMAEVWIDDDALVRRMRLVTREAEELGGEIVTTDTRIDFYDFGITPTIRLPRPRYVFDATSRVRAELGLPPG